MKSLSKPGLVIGRKGEKIEELTRNEIMFQTRLAIAEKLIAGLQNENQKLQANKRVKKDEI